MHRIDRDIRLNTDPPTLWAFIATPMNLDLLTPPDMKFTILSEVPPKMYNGLRLRYEIVLPLLGKQRWLAEIRDIVEGVSFVDVQLEGPYKSWWHLHALGAAPGGGTTMRDVVRYELPFGVAGTLAHELWVKKQLERIFDFRAQKLAEIFP